MNTEKTDYAVKSELARLCLPMTAREADRNLAWMNSICLLFLTIGLFGKPARVRIRPPPPAEEVMPTIMVPVVLPPPTTIRPLTPEAVEPPEKQDEAPVVVTLDSPDIYFSVPTLGTLIAPASLSAAPPLMPMRAPLAQPLAQKKAVALDNTGLGGARPSPPYPPLALEHGLQGTVVLLLNVNEAGIITTIELKQSSGVPILDRSTLDFVKRHWTVPPGPGSRIFQVTISYHLVS